MDGYNRIHRRETIQELAILLFIPAFGNGTGSLGTVSLFGLTGISPWVKLVFIVIISITVLNAFP